MNTEKTTETNGSARLPGLPGIGIERRYVPLAAGAELRAEGEGELPKIHGLACPWRSLSVELWTDWATGKPVFEQFERGAFTDVLAGKPDIVVLRDHDRLHLLGRTASGTANVFETDLGLEYDVDPPKNEDGRSLVELVRRRDLFGSSFSFMARKVEWEETGDRVIRTVKTVSLLEDVSPVTRAAYPESIVSARSVESLQAELAAWRGAVAAAVDPLVALEEHRRQTRARLLAIGA